MVVFVGINQKYVQIKNNGWITFSKSISLSSETDRDLRSTYGNSFRYTIIDKLDE